VILPNRDWDGVSIQQALLNCEIVVESKMTDSGPGPWFSLKLGHKIIPLGIDQHFAKMLKFALVRNASAFEHSVSPDPKPDPHMVALHQQGSDV
jgi:hypothetical protein